jgi:hypothetical protein
MKGKIIITALLLVFVAVSVVYLIVKERGTQPAFVDTAENPSPVRASEKDALNNTADDRTVIVYYFHGNKRCNTCRTIEAYTEAAVNLGFPEELHSGRLVWKAVNVDDPENEHFVQDYKLTTRTVVLVDVDRGNQRRWTKLERVWQLVRDKEAFFEYITENTNAYLAAHDG